MKEETIKLAKEAGLLSDVNGWDVWFPDNLEQFTKLVVASIDPSSFMSYQEGYEAGVAAKHAETEKLKALCQEMLSELYVYRASEYLKDVTAAIKARNNT